MENDFDFNVSGLTEAAENLRGLFGERALDDDVALAFYALFDKIGDIEDKATWVEEKFDKQAEELDEFKGYISDIKDQLKYVYV
tara:strand:+ start:2256 stop:2507 length:252 start_codon:yes stop_codon:yes gene_type:complete